MAGVVGAPEPADSLESDNDTGPAPETSGSAIDLRWVVASLAVLLVLALAISALAIDNDHVDARQPGGEATGTTPSATNTRPTIGAATTSVPVTDAPNGAASAPPVSSTVPGGTPGVTSDGPPVRPIPPRTPSIRAPVTFGDQVLALGDDSVLAWHATGQALWESPRCPSAEFASPVLDPRSRVVPVICDFVNLHGLDLATGELTWQRDRDPTVEYLRSSPDMILLAGTDQVAVVDSTTGETRWEVDAPDPMAVADESTVYISAADGLSAHDGHTGDELWRRPSYPATWLSYGSGHLLLRHRGGVAIFDPTNGTTVIHTSNDLPNNTAIVGATDGVAVTNSLSHGRITAIDMVTGETLWTHQDPDGAHVQAVLGDHHVAIASVDRHLIVVDLVSGRHLLRRRGVELGAAVVGPRVAFVRGGPSGSRLLFEDLHDPG